MMMLDRPVIVVIPVTEPITLTSEGADVTDTSQRYLVAIERTSVCVAVILSCRDEQHK